MRVIPPSGAIARQALGGGGVGGGFAVGKVATGGLTAGNPSTPSLGTGLVDIYTVSGSSLSVGQQVEVVTLLPIKTPANMWVTVETDRFGANWVWRDLSNIKAKPDSTLSVGSSATCSIWEGNSDTSENATVYYNWIDAENISSGKEISIYYDWAELKWLVGDAECET